MLLDPWPFTVGGQDVTGRLIVDDVEAAIRATLRGIGLFPVSRSIVTRHLKEGALETALG